MIRRLTLFVLCLALPCSLATAADFDAATAINQTGLDLYRQLAAKNPDGNLVLSPYSIETALALAYAGAEGKTRDEMAAALHLPPSEATVRTSFAGLREALDQVAALSATRFTRAVRDGGHPELIECHTANRLYGQSGFAFRDSFLTTMKDGYAATFEAIDFRSNPDDARATINAWVDNQTRQKINDLIPERGITSDTRLVLVNALYLKAPWTIPFETEATQPRPFHVRNRESPEVPSMHRTAFLDYSREKNFTAVVVNYDGGELSFLILLPDEQVTPDTVAAKLTAKDFARWAHLSVKSQYAYVDLWLPKFRIAGKTISLRKSLGALGLKSAFDEPQSSANFNGIAPLRSGDYLKFSEVYHQTFLALDEKGTEAAAATAVVMNPGSAMPGKVIEVRVDRPFLFAIQHRPSSTLLFLGRIADPR